MVCAPSRCGVAIVRSWSVHLVGALTSYLLLQQTCRIPSKALPIPAAALEVMGRVIEALWAVIGCACG